MLNEAIFKPRMRYTILKLFCFLSLVAVIFLTVYSVLGSSDANDVSETYQTPNSVRSSRAYSFTQKALEYISEEKEKRASIGSVKAISWIMLEETTAYSGYFNVTYTTEAGDKTAYIRVKRERLKYTIEEITKKNYNGAKAAWLLIFDKNESAYACEQSYSSYAISIISQDTWG